VPADRPTIQAAVDDPLCNPIVLEPNTYFEHVTIERDVVIEGNGSTIDGGGTGRPLTVTGAAVSVSLLELENGIATGLPLLGGAWLGDEIAVEIPPL